MEPGQHRADVQRVDPPPAVEHALQDTGCAPGRPESGRRSRARAELTAAPAGTRCTAQGAPAWRVVGGSGPAQARRPT